MSITWLLVGLISIIFAALVCFLAVRFYTRRRRKAEGLMESPVFSKITDELKVRPNLRSLLSTEEGKALVDTLTFCEECSSTEICHKFFSEESIKSGDSIDFCPNESLFTDLAEKLRKSGTRSWLSADLPDPSN